MVKEPLVTILVVTCNSSKTIVATLDSMKIQTYQNIELVVSDDCSRDNTVELVKTWAQENEGRFAAVKIITTDKNSGVAANNNRGLQVATGYYIKPIAGDDKLISNAIERYVAFLERTGEMICVSDLQIFCDDEGVDIPQGKIDSYNRCFELCKESREAKLRRLAYEYVLLSPGYFYRRELPAKIGGYDDRFPMSEEVPFAMRVLKAGYDICPLDEKLVLYRYSGESLSQHHGEKLGNRRWFKDNRRIFYKIQLPELIRTFRPFHAYSRMMRIEQTNTLYYDGVFAKIGYIIIGILNPYTYYTWIRKTLKR